jgi:hypothetical protein
MSNLSRLVLIVSVLLVSSRSFAAADVESMQKAYEAALARTAEQEKERVDRVGKMYIQELDKIEAAAQKNGDLDGVLAARAEKKRFEEDPVVPKAEELQNDALKALAERLVKASGETLEDARSQRSRHANRYAAQLKDLRDRAARLGDRDLADRADQALRKLSSENADVDDDAGSPVPPATPPASEAAMPAYAKSFPRLASSLAAYTGFAGLPDSVAFAGGPIILDIQGAKAEPASFKGTGASLDGRDSRIVASFPDKMANATEATICIWFKTSSLKATLACLYAGDDAGITLYVDHEGRLEGHAGHASNGRVTSPRPVNDGQWHFGVLAAGGGRVTLYLDGAKAMSVASKGKVSDPGTRLVIGATENRNIFKPAESYFDWTYKGELDEFVLFNKALNENEVRSLAMMMRSAKP